MDYYNSTGIHDNSSYSHNAQFTGSDFGINNITSGTRGASILFDGNDDYLIVNDADTLTAGNQSTLALWIYANTLSSDATVIAKDDTGVPDEFTVGLLASNSKLWY